MYRAIVGIGVLAAICLAVGCGGSGADSTAANETPLSKAQFIKQAEGICTKFGDRWKAALLSVAKDVSGGPKEEEAQGKEAIMQKVAPLLQEEVEELEALPPPVRDDAKVTRMLENFARASQVASSSGDLRKAETSGFEKFAAEATAYGLKGCSS